MKTKTLPFLIGLVMLLMLGAGVYLIYTFFTAPLGEPLALEEPVATQAQAGAAQPVEPPKPVAQATATSAPAATKAAGMCGNTGTMLVLFTGADFSGGVWPYGADSVRLVRLDFDEGEIVSVAFPRDLWLETPGLVDQGMDEQALGLAYYYKKEAASGDNRAKVTAATSLLAQTLLDNFGLKPEHYFTIQLDHVQAMIDTVGGVEISLPAEITTERKVTFPAGRQTLDGRLSAEFLRALYPGGEAARLQRQNLFLQGLRARVISAGTLTKAGELIKQFDQAIVTDLSPKQLTDLACMVDKVSADEQYYYEVLGDDLVVAGPDGVLLPKVENIIKWLADKLD